AEVNRHLEAIGQLLCQIDARLVLEIEIQIGGWIVVEIVAHQKYQVEIWLQAIKQCASGPQPFCRVEDRFRILSIALRSLVEIVNDVGIGDDAEIEAIAILRGGKD